MCYKWSEMPVVVSGNTDLKKKLGRHVFEGCLVSSCLRPTQQTRDPAADSRAYLRPQKRFPGQNFSGRPGITSAHLESEQEETLMMGISGRG